MSRFVNGVRMEKMADIQDEYGNPIELTDEHGNPVALTDEYGNPMRLTGVATRVGTTLGSLIHGGELSDGGVEDGGHGCVSDAKADTGWHGDGEQELQLLEEHEDGGSTSSFEEDEQSERIKKTKKKKGFTQKIIEKLIGGKHKDEQVQAHGSATTMDQSTELVNKGAVEKIGSDLHAN